MTEHKSPILTSLGNNAGSRTHQVRTVTESEAGIVRFAQVPGDFNPVHISSDSVKRDASGGRIAHGMLVGGSISATVAKSLGQEES